MDQTQEHKKHRFFSYIDHQDIALLKSFFETQKRGNETLIQQGFQYAIDNNLNKVVNFYLDHPSVINVQMFNQILLKGDETHFNKASFFLNRIQNCTTTEQASILACAVDRENTTVLQKLVEYIDPTIDNCYALELSVGHKYEEGVNLLLPLCATHLETVLINLKEYYIYNGVIPYFQAKIDEYEALQQKNRLNEKLADTLDTKSNSKRKM